MQACGFLIPLRVLRALVVMLVPLEHLSDKRLCALGSHRLDQQIDADQRQLLRTARAIRTVPLRPKNLDVGGDAYGAHECARKVGNV